MKTAILIIILVFVLLGCGTVATVPVMPNFTTAEEKACARDCQAIYAQCTQPCSQMSDGIIWQPYTRCVNNCNQTLKDCYSSCQQSPRMIENKMLMKTIAVVNQKGGIEKE
jgi:hypothetical protein